MTNLMCTAHVLATDPQFYVEYQADPGSALARRGLSLDAAEAEALRRVSRALDGGKLPPLNALGAAPWIGVQPLNASTAASWFMVQRPAS